jgi:hypothetical protein
MVIKWFPYEIPVITCKMPEGEFGEFFFHPSPHIHISGDLSTCIYSSTLLHEILEMVNEVHDLGLSESQIRTLEVSLTQIVGQTPALKQAAFPPEPVESSESDPGDEDDSEAIRNARSDPRAS